MACARGTVVQVLRDLLNLEHSETSSLETGHFALPAVCLEAEFENHQNEKASGLRGSIRLVKLACLLFARPCLDPYGPKILS